ncbi:MAG: O-phosphoserine--tRNA ligase [Candidatus Altiarchaeales archaeon]|nr:O-phosphoserine--tRNA ligase [Candidatus Altiarchaeales archaeon]MBD3416298.1 O-phosphoserine--tRNA ligase [Candidatus Altiarchaeales archaeon]
MRGLPMRPGRMVLAEMKLDPRKIRAQAKEDYRRAWLETAALIPSKGGDYTSGKGRAHPLHELAQKVRKAFLDLGFDEVENQLFIPEEDVYRQYGPEAPVILDRCYYLGGLTRPDIGLGKDKISEVSSIAEVKPDGLKALFREYREGSIEGDDVLEEMVRRFKLTTDQAAKILDLFPEFKNIKPVCGKTTLRSHMTAAWFPTLSAMQDDMPLKLFSVGLRFRREQKVDSSHLRAHYGGSCVIMDEDISLQSGMDMTKKILNTLDFGDVRFELKKATSNYYAPDTEYEVYSGDIEVADIGMYSPVSLAQYDIEYNVFNLGFGLERILMVKDKVSDIRELLYPQFYSTVHLSDRELAGEISISASPATEAGRSLAESLKKTYTEYATDKSPCSHKAFEGMISGKKVVVNAVEREENSMLLGPAALNRLYVHDGSVYGLPEDTSKLKADVSEVVEKGVKADFTFLDAVAAYIAYEIENQVQAGETMGFIQAKMAKGPSDVNIRVSSKARRFIESNNKRISVKGPVFTAAEYKVC